MFDMTAWSRKDQVGGHERHNGQAQPAQDNICSPLGLVQRQSTLTSVIYSPIYWGAWRVAEGTTKQLDDANTQQEAHQLTREGGGLSWQCAPGGRASPPPGGFALRGRCRRCGAGLPGTGARQCRGRLHDRCTACSTAGALPRHSLV